MPIIQEITTDEALQIVNQLANDQAFINQNYYSGDAWQDGDAWIGPRPADTDSDAETILDQIEAGLVSKNIVNEVVTRHKEAVIGKEPDWSLTVRRPLKLVDDEDGHKVKESPTPAEQALIDEAEAVLTEWWDERQALSIIQDAVANLLISSDEVSNKKFIGRSTLRLFVPPALVGASGVVPKAKDLGEAIMMIYPHAPDLFRSTVWIEPETQRKLGIYAYSNQEQILRDGILATITDQRVEVHGLDDARRTIIKLMTNGDTDNTETQPLDLMGHLAIFEMRRNRFISPQITQLQALANMALTMMGRNVILGGFLERVILNAQLPGTYDDDPANPGQKIFTPNPLYVGAGSTNAFAGLPIYGDPTNRKIVTGYSNPSVVYRDPVAVTTFKDTLAEAYEAILDEVSQLHVLISGDATSSGESRKQAAAEFLKSLNSTKAQIEAAGRWMIETALAMAAQFAGTPGKFKELRASFSCVLDLGPISSEDQKTTILLKDADIIDVTTAMARVGVDDVDAEAAKIAKRKAENAALMPQPTPTGSADPADPKPPVDEGGAS